MKSSFHSLIPFFAIILQLPIPKTRLSSIPLLPSSCPCRLASEISTRPDSTKLFFITTFHGPRRKHILSLVGKVCWQRCCYIVACVFVAAGKCLPSRCLAMTVYTYFTIPDFGRHVTLWNISVGKLQGFIMLNEQISIIISVLWSIIWQQHKFESNQARQECRCKYLD
jgi:hypothetical protein